MRAFPLLLTALGLAAFAGCGRPNPQAESPALPGNETAGGGRVYRDQWFTLRLPADWKAEPVAAQAELRHALEVRAANGVYARLSVLDRSSDAPDLPAQVMANLRQANPSLSSSEHRASWAGLPGAGYRYSFEDRNQTWVGWILSVRTEGSEYVFLGQLPKALALSERAQLEDLMASVRLQSRSRQAPPSAYPQDER